MEVPDHQEAPLTNRQIAQRARRLRERLARRESYLLSDVPTARSANALSITPDEIMQLELQARAAGAGTSTEVQNQISPMSDTYVNWDIYVGRAANDNTTVLNSWPDLAEWPKNWDQYVDNTKDIDTSTWGEWPTKTMYFRHKDWSFKMELDTFLIDRIRRRMNPDAPYVYSDYDAAYSGYDSY